MTSQGATAVDSSQTLLRAAHSILSALRYAIKAANGLHGLGGGVQRHWCQYQVLRLRRGV